MFTENFHIARWLEITTYIIWPNFSELYGQALYVQTWPSHLYVIVPQTPATKLYKMANSCHKLHSCIRRLCVQWIYSFPSPELKSPNLFQHGSCPSAQSKLHEGMVCQGWGGRCHFTLTSTPLNRWTESPGLNSECTFCWIGSNLKI